VKAAASSRLSKANVRKLAKALIRGGDPATPDFRGLAEFLISVFLMLDQKRSPGRPLTRTMETEAKMLSNFEAIRDHLQLIRNTKLSVMAVLTWINGRRPRPSRHSQQELNTAEKRLSRARAARRRQTAI
jgi:hypothetical protein